MKIIKNEWGRGDYEGLLMIPVLAFLLLVIIGVVKECRSEPDVEVLICPVEQVETIEGQECPLKIKNREKSKN